MPAYVVQYGRLGYVGRFSSEAVAVRGDRVRIRSPRGLEVGTVLGAARFSAGLDMIGELLGPAGVEPDSTRAEDVLAAAEELLGDLPLTLVDAEPLLETVILHAIPWAACDADPLLTTLSDRFGLPVRLLDLSRTPTAVDPPEPKTSCGPGCGTKAGGCSSCGTGGGCSTGSCSKGSVKSADDLTAYFLDLRNQMESRRVPLG